MNTMQGKHLPKDRLESLTDGAYTVALTLLVTTLGLPEGHMTDAQFDHALLEQVPKIITWLLSAVLIIFNWMTFVRITNFLERMTPALLFIGLAQILLVTLLPFSTTLIGEHWQHPVSVVIYSANLWIVVAIAYWRVTYVQARKDLQISDTDPYALEYLARTSRILFIFTSISFALAYVLPGWNLLAYAGAKVWIVMRGIKAPSDLQ